MIQRYYIEYLSGADTNNLNHVMQQLSALPEDEATLLNSFQATVSTASVKQIENNEPVSFRALRLDWFRFQTYTSVSKLSFSLMKHTSLAKIMNTICFHSKLVDYIDELLFETSDLSLFWLAFCVLCYYFNLLINNSIRLAISFYPNLFFENFHICFEYPSQLRYSIAFPLVCAHFMSCTHELCPEEVN